MSFSTARIPEARKLKVVILTGLLAATFAAIMSSAPTAKAQPHPYTIDYSTYLGGSLFEQTRDVATDPCGNIYITGGTQSVDFPVTPGANDTTHNGWMDVFVVKMNRRGDIIWSTFLGGPNYDRAYAIELDPLGYVYVGGRAGDGFPTTPGVLQTAFAGDTNPGAYGLQDGFVAKLTPDGSQVVWATYFGGPGSDFLRDIDVDDVGGVYLGVAGANQDNPHITPGAFDTVRNGMDAMVARIAPDATSVVYASYVGGSGNDGGAPTIRVDGNENAYLLTATTADDAPASPGAYQTTRAGGQDMLLTKFNATGAFLWGTYFGGSGGEGTETHHLAIDPQGNPVMAAYTSSSDLPTTSGVIQPGYGGSGDAFVAAISSNGSMLMASTYLGGSVGDGPEGTTIDEFGDIYVSGATNSANFPTTPNAHQPSLAGGSDMFGVKLSPDLTELRYSTYFGGGGADSARSSTIWGDRTFILVGQTDSNNFPLVNPTQGTYGGGTGDNAIVAFSIQDGPPVADAGQDQTVPRYAPVYLDGTGSYDPDGDCLLYKWDQIGGPNVTLTGNDTATPTFTPNVTGLYEFELVVDDCFRTDRDTVNVTVTRMPPSATLSVNPPVLKLDEVAEVTANGSMDSDGTIVSYNFTFGDGSSSGDIASPWTTHSWSSSGMYTVTVLVTDDGGDTDTASTTVNVAPNEPPTCNITSPPDGGTISGLYLVTGTASDPDGTVQYVEVRVDGFGWTRATGTTSWTYDLDTTLLSDMAHTIQARSFDGMDYSSIASVTVTVNNALPPHDEKPVFVDLWFWLFIITLIALTTILILLYLKRRKKREEAGAPPTEPIDMNPDQT